MSTALVPVRNTALTTSTVDPFRLVEQSVTYTTREEVKKHLPDICSKALARSWIDKEFYTQLKEDPIETLKTQGVHLPHGMSITFENSNSNRPKLVVWEQPSSNGFKVRVCGLQLTMMATR
jgi:hypothetical protein|tara:strand:+ start:710 stop:1072 length:363 start_codon:yes stop_codon:yes gene_type:complete